jgi:hypothetical protein
VLVNATVGFATGSVAACVRWAPVVAVGTFVGMTVGVGDAAGWQAARRRARMTADLTPRPTLRCATSAGRPPLRSHTRQAACCGQAECRPSLTGKGVPRRRSDFDSRCSLRPKVDLFIARCRGRRAVAVRLQARFQPPAGPRRCQIHLTTATETREGRAAFRALIAAVSTAVPCVSHSHPHPSYPARHAFVRCASPHLHTPHPLLSHAFLPRVYNPPRARHLAPRRIQ